MSKVNNLIGPLLVCVLAAGAIGSIVVTRLLKQQTIAPESRRADEIVRVGEHSITAREFREAWARRQPSGDLESARSTLRDDLIRRELLFAEAQRTGFTQREDVQTAWHSFVASRFQEELETRSAKPTAVTDDEVAAHYRAHVEEYSSAERRRLALIFLRLAPSSTAEARAHLAEEAQSLRDRVSAESATSQDFSALAAQHSAHQASRYSGGDVGWVSRAQAGRAWPGEVVDAAFALPEAGGTTPVIQTGEGCYLLKLIDRQPGKPAPLDSVRERIRYQLGRARTAQEEARRLAELRKVHPVQVFVQNLETLLPGDHTLAAQTVPSLPTP